MHDHALAVDVLHPQTDEFAAPDAGGIKKHQHGPSLDIAGGIDQLGHFFWTQDFRYPVLAVFRIRDRVGRKTALQCAHEEKAQTGCLRNHRSHRQFSLVQQVSLPLTNMFRAELIGRFTEVAGEPLDGANIRACSSFREVTSLEFLQHYFAKTGHSGTSL